MSGDLKIAARILSEEGQSLVVVRDGRLLFSSRLQGIQPLLDALDHNVLPGSALADKVVGRAAAMIAVLGEVNAVHSPLMSQEAVDVLSEAGILHCADKVVEQILNQGGTGPCPLEIATNFTVIPEKGVMAVRKFLKGMHGTATRQHLH